MLEGGNPNARHHGKGLERATFGHGFELSYCLVTVRALTETVAHSVLYTADRLISFGYNYDPNCFCGSPETPSHLLYECALARSVLGWIQSLMFHASPLCPSLLVYHVLIGFSASELAWFLTFLFTS